MPSKVVGSKTSLPVLARRACSKSRSPYKTGSGGKDESSSCSQTPCFPPGSSGCRLLTPGAAWDTATEIPDGAIVLTVRESKAHVPIVVTHLGFKVSSTLPDKPFLRHATKMGKQPRVRNDWLHWYIEHNRWYHWWPVAGFTVLMPREQGPAECIGRAGAAGAGAGRAGKAGRIQQQRQTGRGFPALTAESSADVQSRQLGSGRNITSTPSPRLP